MNDEFRIILDDKIIFCPAYPMDCDYVRITDLEGREVAYWHYNEWQEEPQEVMGAIMASIGNDLMKIKLLIKKPEVNNDKNQRVRPMENRKPV